MGELTNSKVLFNGEGIDGSINFLSFGYSEESIMRLESSSIAYELAESIKNEKEQ